MEKDSIKIETKRWFLLQKRHRAEREHVAELNHRDCSSTISKS